MVMIELSESEKPRAPPPPTFSAPFASPSLRWACKKRLRCFHPDDAAAAAGLRLSPSPSPDRPLRRRPPSLVVGGGCSPSRPPASLSPPPPSPRGRILIRLPSPSSLDDDGGRPLAAAPDLSSRPVPGEGMGTEEASRRVSDAVGWSLRSAVRNGEGKGKVPNKKRVELWISLSRDEIEEDFLWMTGAKPPRRSRRRDRGPSDHLLMGVFPGSWMPNRVSAARYRVSEPSDPRKE